jgi:ATP-dependent HslUV protease subunit HslV
MTRPGDLVRATTVLAVIREGAIAMASDGQVTVGEAVMKQGAQKVRLAANGNALIGFAGGAADAMALTERLESRLEAHPGNVRRAAVELAKEWRMDRARLCSGGRTRSAAPLVPVCGRDRTSGPRRRCGDLHLHQ